MMDRMIQGVSKRATLVIATIAAVITSLMMSAVHIALPMMGREFAMEAVLLGWVITAMTLPQAAVVLASGRFADIYGRKKMFLYGMVLFTVSSFLCSVAHTAVALIAYRVLQGIAGGMVFSTQIAIITSVFPGEERGRALGTVMGAVFTGLAAGPFFGGVLTEHLGWRSIFYISAFFCMVAVILIFWKLKGEWAEARGEKFDAAGSVFLGISMVVLMYGFTVLTTVPGIVLVVLGILGLTGFVWWEARTDSPILDINIFRRNTIFVFSNLATLIHFCAVFASVFLLSLYLQYTHGMSPQSAGIIMLTQMVFMAVFSLISGRLSDRVDPLILASVGMAFISVGLVMFVFLDEGTTLGYILSGLAILGFGSGVFSSPNANAIMGSVEKRFLGVASGTQGTMRSSGQMLGMGIVMIIFSLYIGAAEITPDYYPEFLVSVRIAYITFAVISVVGILVQFTGRRVGRAQKEGG
jgi:EmrB/QacA subfamily drug resistance transporter